MPYLIPVDYLVNIQDVNIQQIINNDETIRDRAQLAGETEAQSYLKQKYDISREFQDMQPWSLSTTYYGFQRFYFYGPQYNENNTYNVNQLATYNGIVYICNSNGITGAFNPNDWSYLGKLYEIHYTKTPHPEFDYSALYNIGDQVFWKNKVYQCKVQTAILDHDTALQYREIKDLPLPNVAPDDPISGLQYWGAGVPYSVYNEDPNDSQFFSTSDNRDAQMVLYLCDIVLYHLHTRIAPRNIPDLRVKRYDDAIAWLRMCAEGNVTPNLPLIKPKQGNRIRYGGGIRQINSY
jgi:hypothetical protein